MIYGNLSVLVEHSLIFILFSHTSNFYISAKEIQLQHRAPVISVGVIDRNAQPLPGPLEVENERAKAADMTGNHHVVVISEEQFKVSRETTLQLLTL